MPEETHTTTETRNPGNHHARHMGYPQVESPATVVRSKPFQEDLRSKLEAFQKDQGLTNGELGKKLGVSATAVSKYINGKPEGDVQKLESVAADVLKTSVTFRRIDKRAQPTSVSKTIAATINTARKTNDVALITGPAGIGKSKGLELFHIDNPSSLLITAAAWCRNAAKMFQAVWHSVENSSYSNRAGSKMDFLLGKLKGSNRPLIIDNAHRLLGSGLQFVFDFHDETDMPIALVGNPEILEVIRRNDQQFSRIGIHKHIESFEEPRAVAEMVINQVAPEFAVIEGIAVKVLTQHGKARALRKQLSLAQELASKENFRTELAREGITADDAVLEAAFEAAHTRLIRNYKL